MRPLHYALKYGQGGELCYPDTWLQTKDVSSTLLPDGQERDTRNLSTAAPLPDATFTPVPDKPLMVPTRRIERRLLRLQLSAKTTLAQLANYSKQRTWWTPRDCNPQNRSAEPV